MRGAAPASNTGNCVVTPHGSAGPPGLPVHQLPLCPIHTIHSTCAPLRRTLHPVLKFLPGVALAAVLAFMARWLHDVPSISRISALMLAIVLGMTIRNTIG